MISAPRERMIYLRCDIALSRDEIRLRRMKNGYYIIHARSGVYIIRRKPYIIETVPVPGEVDRLSFEVQHFKKTEDNMGNIV